MNRDILTPDLLNSILHYSSSTGHLHWMISLNGRVRAGQRAGRTNTCGHTQIGIWGRKYMAHRLIWLMVYGEWPINEIDHINGIPGDNRLENLREVTRSENMMNQRIRETNKSGCLGVYWDNRRRAWVAQITVNQEQQYLGQYPDWFDAVCARKAAENKFNFHPNHGRLA